jgi:hypothetical protein
VLLAFDFDHTVIDDNSDTYVIKAHPEQALPRDLELSYQAGGSPAPALARPHLLARTCSPALARTPPTPGARLMQSCQ